uniref:Tetratricopeptide repeat-containing protein n=1 Tax=Candidatus Kentrum sp. FW TaxID=2126338 RepID=A0A450TSL1_9GAMM|nr:MAG: Tetratricopeptide repeat-containing protein [Candidatus Kentron sp. FW]
MRIISFFSFKGGVGRTALLTNLGAHWAAQGRVVALMDLDLIAPGISYSPLLGDYLDPRATGLGMSDLLATYHGEKPSENAFNFLPPHYLLQEMQLPDGAAPGGRLFVIGAGSPGGGEEYARNAQAPASGIIRPIPRPRIAEPDAETLQARTLRGLAEHIRKDLTEWRVPENLPGGDADPAADPSSNRPIDYLLIDARTGFGELIDLSLGYLADHMVLVSGLNDQNIQGLRLTLRALWEQRRVPLDEMPNLVTVVFSPIPAGEDDAVLASLEQAHGELLANLRHTQSGQWELAPRTFGLHYTPLLAISEEPILPGRANSLYGQEARAIADHLAGEEISGEEISDKGFEDRLQEEARRRARRIINPPAPRLAERPMPAPRPERPNPFTDLPAWHWPLGAHTDTNTRARQLDRLLGKIPQGERPNPEGFLDRLAWDIFFDGTQKRETLASLARLGKNQWQELSQTMERQRERALSLWGSSQYRLLLMGMLVRTRQEWATLVLEDDDAAEHRARLDQHPLPSAEHWPEYWLAIANRIHTSSGEDGEVLAAVDQAIQRAVPEETTLLAERIMELTPPEMGTSSLQAELEARARRLAPEHPWLDFLTARRLLKGPSKDPARAQMLLKPLLETPPEDAGKCFHLGILVLNQLPAMAAETETAFRKAIELDPKDADSWNNLGLLLMDHLNRPEEAEAAFRKAIELDPKLVAPWNGLGLLQWDWRRDCQGALASFRAGLERTADDKESQAYLYMNLGHTLQLLGHPAREELEKALMYFDGLESTDNAHALHLALELGDDERVAKYQDRYWESLSGGQDKWSPLVVLAELLEKGEQSVPTDLMADITGKPKNWFEYWVYIQTVHLLCGFRAEARTVGRAVVKALLALPSEITDNYPDQPRPGWRERYLPFAEGRSDGAGDPRERALFCREG